MKVQVVGSGGAFDEFGTCFIVDDSVLIDCCPSAIKKTFKDGRAEKITDIFITHCHQDHVGGIEALLYYFMYVLDKPAPKIHCPHDYYEQALELEYFREMRRRNKSSYRMAADRILSGLSQYVPSTVGKLLVTPFPVVHSSVEAYGFVVRDLSANKVIVFSGDVDRALDLPDVKFDLMFHDIGWEGLPDRPTRCHPFEHEVVKAFGEDANIVTVHKNLPRDYPRHYINASSGECFHV